MVRSENGEAYCLDATLRFRISFQGGCLGNPRESATRPWIDRQSISCLEVLRRLHASETSHCHLRVLQRTHSSHPWWALKNVLQSNKLETYQSFASSIVPELLLTCVGNLSGYDQKTETLISGAVTCDANSIWESSSWWSQARQVSLDTAIISSMCTFRSCCCFGFLL